MRLKVIQQGSVWRSFALRAYRLAVLVVIIVMIRDLAVRLRVQGDAPIELREVRAVMPEAAAIDIDPGPRGGLFVYDENGQQIGYAIRTSPTSDKIIGYSGPTDTLVVFNDEMLVVGIRIRSSTDTKEHVEDVKADEYFMNAFTGMSWQHLSEFDPRAEGIEGVSGATYTSMTVADGIKHRVHTVESELAKLPPMRISWSGIGVAAVILAALLLSFTHLRGKRWLRVPFQLIVIGYIGFYAGDLVAQALLLGWAESGVAWRTAPALALMTAAALLIPWTTRRPLYCGHLCPHGAAQELIGRIVPWRIKVPHGVGDKLKWLPVGLLAVVIIGAMLNLPLNAASVEPFDAYLIKTAGWATITVAIIGLVVAAFIPQAYCKYGCPTGTLLNFVRSHGHADHFARRDLVATLMVGLVAVLYFYHDPIHAWILGPNAPW
ncbi:4Fe-4S binding protein [Planctomycetales bacterium ZRK34]|nr:4Fe-4S binding protein [Planctomycetales bacterium ZRK34]